VLIVMLIGSPSCSTPFPVALRPASSPSRARALALTGSGDLIWDWDARRQSFYQPETEQLLGLKRGNADRNPPPSGSTCCIHSTATGPCRARNGVLDQRARTSGAGISACAPRTAITSGSR